MNSNEQMVETDEAYLTVLQLHICIKYRQDFGEIEKFCVRVNSYVI